MIKAMVAVSSNWCIGKDNKLLFKLEKDMALFKLTTLNEIVVCGRRTLESLPGSKPLKGRSTICLCSKENSRDDCYCVHDLTDLIKLIKELSKTHNVFIIGGGKLYKALLPICQEVLVTKVDVDVLGDTYFPNLDKDPNFKLTFSTDKAKDGDYTTQFCVYERQ